MPDIRQYANAFGKGSITVLLTGAYKYSKDQLAQIEDLGYEIVYVEDERLPLKVDPSAVEAVVCNGLFLYNEIDRFENLKFIQLTSAGLDRVPIDYIRENGIYLANARGVYSVPMAEWAVLKVLEIYKKSRIFFEAQRRREWIKQRDLRELTGKTVTIVGFGSVGLETAKRFKAFDTNVIAVDQRMLEPAELTPVDAVYDPRDIDQALRISDVVVLTLPLTEQTRHFINADRLASMKEDSVLVNLSRGGVIDEKDLIEALSRGKFLGAALDVFEEEPLPHESPIWKFERVSVTPHNSFISDGIHKKIFLLIKASLFQWRLKPE